MQTTAEIEVKEQCKSCFHFQVCANVLKQQLFAREIMLKEENPKCEHYKPTADVVSVVRCKDCLYAREIYGKLECIHGVSYRNSYNRPDDYCNYGERRCE